MEELILISELRKAADFLEKYPQFDMPKNFSGKKASLQKALNGFLEILTSLEEQIESEKQIRELECQPLYIEVSRLIEERGKAVAKTVFMKNFAQSELKVKFTPAKSDKKSRKQFIELAAKAGKLEHLRKLLDPEKPLRDKFIELVARNGLQEIERQLSEMNDEDLTALLSANGIKFTKAKGLIKRKAKTVSPKILQQIGIIKQQEHF